MSTATLIKEAKAALAAADAADEREVDARQLASDARWKAAECMAVLSDGGMGHRDIAAAVGVSSKTVDRYVACWRKPATVRTQLFTDVMREIRSGWGNVPTSIEGRAKAVADYVKDPEVFRDPKVIAAVSAAQQQASRDRLPPKPVASLPPPRGLTAAEPVARADYWTKLFVQVEACRKELQVAVTEMGRSGLPEARVGQLVRELRQLAAVAQKAEQLLTDEAIGRPA